MGSTKKKSTRFVRGDNAAMSIADEWLAESPSGDELIERRRRAVIKVRLIRHELDHWAGVLERLPTPDLFERIERAHREICSVRPFDCGLFVADDCYRMLPDELLGTPANIRTRCAAIYRDLPARQQRAWRIAFMRYLDRFQRERGPQFVTELAMDAVWGAARETWAVLLTRWPLRDKGRTGTSKWKLLADVLKSGLGAHVAPGTLENEWAFAMGKTPRRRRGDID